MSRENAVRLGLGLALIILGAVGFLAYRSTSDLVATANSVSRTHDVIDGLDDVLINVLEIESAARGYVATGQEDYLEPYYAALTRIDKTFLALEKSINGAAAQQHRLRTLKSLVEAKSAFHQRVVELRRQGVEEARPKLLTPGEGHQMMDRIRDQVTGIREEEKRLLLERMNLANRDATRSMRSLLTGSLLGFSILFAIFFQLDREIGRRQRSERKLIHLNRLYALLNRVSQAAMRIRDRGELLQEACRHTTEHGLFRMAWVGLVDDATGRVETAAHAGVENGYLDAVQASTSQEPEAQRPAAEVLRGGRRWVSNDIRAGSPLAGWREEAARRGYLSCAAFPIQVQGKVVGVFTVYAPEPNLFDDETVALVEEVAADLSLALEAMEQESRRLRAEQILRQQARILDQVHDSIICTDLDGNVTSWNNGAERLTGYTREESLGRHVSFLYPEEEREFLERQVIGPLKEKGDHELRVRMRRKSGEDLYAHLSLSLLHNEQGGATGMIGYSVDITEVKRREEALRESEERFRQLAENIEEMFWMTDRTLSRVLYVSPGYATIWGRSPESLYHEPRLHLAAVHPEDRERVFAGVERALRGESWDEEFRIVQPDGSVRWVRDRAFPVRDASGALYRFVGITRDITERTIAEDEIRKLNQDLERRVAERTAELARVNRELELRNQEVERASRMKSEFLARMSHELRTPLNAIVGYSDLLAEDQGPHDERHRRFVKNVQEGAQHLLQLVNDLLDLSKIEAGRVELSLEAFPAVEVLREVLSVIMPLAEIKRLRIDNLLDPDLVVCADRVRFKQILYNLLSNAVKFTPEGGRVWVESRERGASVDFCVGDTGIGVAPGQRESIFDEFHQSGPATEGTGLGLAITRHLAELHGGKVWVESELGQGSRFYFTMPAHNGAGVDDVCGKSSLRMTTGSAGN